MEANLRKVFRAVAKRLKCGADFAEGRVVALMLGRTRGEVDVATH